MLLSLSRPALRLPGLARQSLCIARFSSAPAQDGGSGGAKKPTSHEHAHSHGHHAKPHAPAHHAGVDFDALHQKYEEADKFAKVKELLQLYKQMTTTDVVKLRKELKLAEDHIPSPREWEKLLFEKVKSLVHSTSAEGQADFLMREMRKYPADFDYDYDVFERLIKKDQPLNPREISNMDNAADEWKVPYAVLRKKNTCYFCQEKKAGKDMENVVFSIYNVNLLLKFVNERGMITGKKFNGNCAKHQRHLASTIKTARNMGIMAHGSNWRIPKEYYGQIQLAEQEALKNKAERELMLRQQLEQAKRDDKLLAEEAD